ncbi:unnamed protein product [Linum tenue]|uniref:ENTH domain-containing protein n=1 Tax=Linum tenue TaxID=586396 RepID=A0AAV0MMB8_9ROSI|nr:unnamed protein product [Linum tenue]
MGRHRSRLRILVGILKDKSSILKSFLISPAKPKLRLAILRATSHAAASPPSDRSISGVLSLGGHGSRRTAGTCIESLMDRLHATKSAYVAIKCLFTVHAVLTKGSFILKDQLSVYPASGGRNSLNLSKFRDGSDPESWELSSWVRWYAAVIEQNLAVSRTLGRFLSAAAAGGGGKEEAILEKGNGDLITEVGILVDFAQLVCEAPNSLQLQKNDLVYEVVKSVGEDYRLVQREILIRVGEFRDRKLRSLSFGELTRLVGELRRLEGCRERLSLLFVIGKRNDALWEAVAETVKEISEAVMEKDEMKRLVPAATAVRLGNWMPAAARTGSIELGRVEAARSGSTNGGGSIDWL